MYEEELRAVFRRYRVVGPSTKDVAGEPRMPDQPGGGTVSGPNWAAGLTPRDAARVAHAIDQGARNGAYAGPWTELA